jgi:hypothetical protein
MQATLPESYQNKRAVRVARLLKGEKGARDIFIGEVERLAAIVPL